jgi:hypothetical protein
VRHVRMLGLCLVAMVAVAALGASSAVASPQFGKCVVAEGEFKAKYVDPNCTETQPKESRVYRWENAKEVEEERIANGKPGPVHFTGKGGKGLLNTGGQACYGGEYANYRVTREKCVNGGGTVTNEEGLSVECEEESNEGDAVGKNKLANIEVTFTGCLILGEVECHSAGAAESEIKTKTLKGKLGYPEPEGKAKHEAAVLLEPQAGKSKPFAEFYCLFEYIKTVVGRGNKKEGSYYVIGTNYPAGCGGECPGATPEEEKRGGNAGIISPIIPVNEMTATYEQKFVGNKSEAEPQNIPSKLENKNISLLEDYVENGLFLHEDGSADSIMWAPASEEITNVNTPEEESEIKA